MKLYRVQFMSGPWDGHEINRTVDNLPLNYEERFLLPRGAFHLYMLQAAHGCYRYEYQGARSGQCVGK